MGNTINGYGLGQIGAGIDGALDTNAQTLLSDPDFVAKLSTYAPNGDINNLQSSDIQKAADAFNNSTVFTPNTTNSPSWTLDGSLDSIGGMLGTNGATLKGLGGMFNTGLGAYNTFNGIINSNKKIKLAQDNYNFQKGLALEKERQANEDRNRFFSNQKAATAQYYGN